MRADVLVAEIGSTTTVVSAFDGINTPCPKYLGQGQSPTTVLEGDVCVGLERAIASLEAKLGEKLTHGEMFATSSAAGGLRMSVHGLVHEMTVRAAEAAALGAGGVIVYTTAGRLTRYDLDDLKAARPNLILLSGGTDFGERETALFNARALAELGLDVPVVYAGNVQNRRAVSEIFAERNIELEITENVYPRLDELNIEPTRVIIHRVFQEHILKAPGMENIHTMVDHGMLPTPGAVMAAARLLYERLGDLAVIDIGGATTDIHSVTDGSDEIAAISTSPEPFFKRTVEGDLGLYINAKNVLSLADKDALARKLGLDIDAVMADYKPIPFTTAQVALTEELAVTAGVTALTRHAGKLRHIYTPSGRRTTAEGKDLTKVTRFIGTGGALTRLPHRESVFRRIADCNIHGMMLMKKPGEIKLLYDNHYIMASAGVLGTVYPEAAVALMLQSMEEA